MAAKETDLENDPSRAFPLSAPAQMWRNTSQAPERVGSHFLHPTE